MKQWYEMTREEKLGYYARHIDIPIPPPIEDYKVSMTERYVLWMMVLGWKIKRSGELFHHYENINNTVREAFDKPKFNLSSYGRLAVEPFALIAPEKNVSHKANKSGYFTLTSKGIAFINGKVKVPRTVSFTGKFHDVVGSEYVYIHEVPKTNFQETLNYLKTY